jgi:hypothetical protein
MSQKNNLTTHRLTKKKEPKQKTVVISIRVPESFAFLLKLKAKEDGLKSAGDLLLDWINHFAIYECSKLKQAKGIELTPIEQECVKFYEKMSPVIENTWNTLLELEEKGIISSALDFFRFEPLNKPNAKSLSSGQYTEYLDNKSS